MGITKRIQIILCCILSSHHLHDYLDATRFKQSSARLGPWLSEWIVGEGLNGLGLRGGGPWGAAAAARFGRLALQLAKLLRVGEHEVHMLR